MTRTELASLLGAVEAAQLQLQSIADRVRKSMGVQPGQDPTARRPVSAGAKNNEAKPDDTKLTKFKCPRCKSAMRWQWSRANGEWFAGCTKFRTEDCRGSCTHDEVMGLTAAPAPVQGFGTAAPAVEPDMSEPEPEPLPFEAYAEDLQRIDKHHP